MVKIYVNFYSALWEEKTGYVVSPAMTDAVSRAINAGDPFGSSTDDPEYISMMTTRILNAALLP